jgi:hypothetical protein
MELHHSLSLEYGNLRGLCYQLRTQYYFRMHGIHIASQLLEHFLLEEQHQSGCILLYNMRHSIRFGYQSRLK